MRLNTSIDRLSDEQLLNIGYQTLLWCHGKFGPNTRKRTPLKMVLYTKSSDYFGCYDFKKNRIVVCKEKHKTLAEFIRTIIHEYTHYLQPIRSYYHLVGELTGYKNNPYEQEAIRNELLFYKNCWMSIKKFF